MKKIDMDNGQILLAAISAIAGVIVAVYSGAGGKWIEGRIGLSQKRVDELIAIRKSQGERIDKLETKLEAQEVVIDKLQEEISEIKEDKALLMQQNRELITMNNNLKRIINRLIEEVNRLRKLVGEPDLILKEFLDIELGDN